MKTRLTIFLAAVAGAAFGAVCPKCSAKLMSDADKFCWSCGADLEEYRRESRSQAQRQRTVVHDGGELPFYLGMGRGLMTVACSPIEYLRTGAWIAYDVTMGEHDNMNAFERLFGFPFFVPTGTAVMGSISAICDTVTGLADFISFGAYGDAFWDTYHTPYFWERGWGKTHRPSGALGW